MYKCPYYTQRAFCSLHVNMNCNSLVFTTHPLFRVLQHSAAFRYLLMAVVVVWNAFCTLFSQAIPILNRHLIIRVANFMLYHVSTSTAFFSSIIHMLFVPFLHCLFRNFSLVVVFSLRAKMGFSPCCCFIHCCSLHNLCDVFCHFHFYFVSNFMSITVMEQYGSGWRQNNMQSCSRAEQYELWNLRYAFQLLIAFQTTQHTVKMLMNKFI